MSYHTPISIMATYVDENGESVEKQFESLNKASKFLSLTQQALKTMLQGGTPKLNSKSKVPKELKIVRIELPPHIKPSKDEIWHCDVCNYDIKHKSKYAHIETKGHIRIRDVTNNLTKQ